MKLTLAGYKKVSDYIRALECVGAKTVPTVEQVESELKHESLEYRNDFGNGFTCLVLTRSEDYIEEDYLNADEYQRLAMRTNDGKMSERLTRPEVSEKYDLGGILEGCLGIAGESGELVDLIKKWIFHEKPLDETHVKKELGDVLWYAALLCESFGWKLSDVMSLNIEKLRKRYPDGFNAEAANNRKEGDV